MKPHIAIVLVGLVAAGALSPVTETAIGGEKVKKQAAVSPKACGTCTRRHQAYARLRKTLGKERKGSVSKPEPSKPEPASD